MGDQFRRHPVRPIASGMNTAQNPVLLAPGESPDLLNVDLDRESIAATGGSTKFNNQTAPRPGLLVGTPSNGATLPVLPGKSVPVRGSLFIPYSESQDIIGADYTEDITTLGAPVAPNNRSFMRQRGKSFDIQQSFRLPATEKLYKANATGQLYAPAGGTILGTKFGADEALDEFFALVQKGGDRFTPMSWALGVVNTGALFDTDVGGGLNIFGLSVAAHASRVSNYALCFMWLDAPCTGVDRPLCARYNLANGSVVMTEAAAAITGFPTFAYRAMIVPFFIEPGVDYHVALRLTRDSGTAGTTWTAATGTLSGIAWNADGVIDWRVQREYDAVQSFTSTNGAGTEVLRYKGPSDTLEYFCKYGVRYHGRDAMHVGLGYRYAAWTSGGFIPFGIDSCPTENGGFQITDHSVHGPFGSLYQEYFVPEQEPGGFNTPYQTHSLKFEYDTTDATGTKFGVSNIGLVGSTGAIGQNWGNEGSQWANIDSVCGKNPWSPHNSAWAGLGGLLTTGFNKEALKSYRMVFVNDSGGNTTDGIAGALVSIGSYEIAGVGLAGYTFGQHIIAEGGDQLTAHVDMNTAANRRLFVVRAFRWNQRPVVVSDLRLYASPRTWDVRADFSLGHELDPKRTGDPGLTTLRGHWPMSDGGGQKASETIAGNVGYFSPMAGQAAKSGGVFLSGEGEALYLNLAENPDFRQQLRSAMASGKCGVAIQISMMLPEAQYGLSQRFNNEVGAFGGSSIYQSKFAPPLAVWDFEDPNRLSDVAASEGISVSSTQFDHMGGNLSRPQPLLEFGHNVRVENAVGVEPFSYPLGFSLMAPVKNAAAGAANSPVGADFNDADRSVPGTGATGLHAWYNTGTNTSRWDKLAGWAGKEIIVQFGLEPVAGTADSYRPYIAAWPKEFLNPVANDPSGAEFAYYASAITVSRRQVERSVVVIGGSWNPKMYEAYYTGGPNEWFGVGRAAHECSARMIVRDVRVFGAAPAGLLPTVSGGVTASGAGKIIGDNALAITALKADDLVYPVASAGTPVNFTQGSRTVSSSGSSFVSQALPSQSRFAIQACFLAVVGDLVHVPQEGTDGVDWQRTYFVDAVTAASLTLNRPAIGASRRAAAAKCFRVLGYTAFEDEVQLPLTVGKGRGYNTGSVTTRDAQITQKAFENLAPIGSPWRWRVYSAIPSGSSVGLLPSWARGVKRSAWNSVRGLHAVGETLYAGAQASLFEADDRWRPFGPTANLAVSVALRALAGAARLPLQSDRVVFQDTTLLKLGSTLAVEGGTAYLAVFDAWIKPAEIEGVQTIAWLGRLDTNPLLSVGSHGVQLWSRLRDGYPELVVGSTAVSGGVNPPRGLFIARGARRVTAAEWSHVRWGILGVATGAINSPVLWINGKRVAVTLNATDDAAVAGGNWIVQASIPWDASHVLVLGAARDAITSQVSTRTFTAPADASQAPKLPANLHGWCDVFGGDLAGVVVSRETDGVGGFSSTADFDPLAISYTARRFAALETSQSAYGSGSQVLDAALPQFGTIFSHPLISITHAMEGGDEQWSFTEFESDLYCANGGRVGIIDSTNNSFRFAGLQGPRSLPKVEVVRTPLWKANVFVEAGDPDNDPIFNVESDISASPYPTTKSTPVAGANTFLRNFHYNNPGTRALQQPADASMAWVRDSFIAFKCYVRMNSVTGRISIFSMRDSMGNGMHFLEIRDGYLYAGWYDTDLKEEVFIRTSAPVIEPGYVYYLYYRKWFPRGGLAGAYNAQMTKSDSNWANSIFCANGNAGTLEPQMAYDSLIFRRFPRVAPSGFFGWTGYDAKAIQRNTDATAGWDGAAPYLYPQVGSSGRMCISATAADSTPAFNAYTQLLTPTGLVMEPTAIAAAGNRGDATGRIRISVGGTGRFVLDHVGMLLEVRDPSLVFDKHVFRIVEFISASTVRCIDILGAAPAFNLLPLGCTVSVYMGVSLVKSDNYDKSKSPDSSSYPVEVYGSSLQSQPLNGMAPFDGEGWSFAYGIFPGQTSDDGANVVGLPNIFEDVTAINCPVASGAGSQLACACEAGTDMFGLQGSFFAVPTGLLPYQGVPAGELAVDTGFAHTAVDCTTYLDRIAAYAGVVSAPSSTKPNEALTVANPESGADLTWLSLNPVLTGTRTARLSFYSPDRAIESPLGDAFTVRIPEEDKVNPSAAVQLVFSLLPACPDGPGFSTRIYLTQPASTVLFLRAQVDDGEPDSLVLAIDEVNSALLGAVDPTVLGVPPNAYFVQSSQGRMFYGKLPDQADGVMFSLSYLPEIVPVENIFPANEGTTEITALADFKGGLVVFKRDRILPYVIDPSSGLPLLRKSGLADGCVASTSIASLEDRLYYMSDRGPQVMLDNWTPFYVGRQVQEYFASQVDFSQLDRISGAFNRRRNQYVFTVKSLARARMDERWALEFQHPSKGEDIERAEMAAGHRSSFYQGPNCTALGSVQPRGGGPALLVGGTDQGFVVWMDRSDHKTVLKGPEILAGATPAFGGRTFVKGAAALAGSFNRALEGHMGEVLRAYLNGEHEAYVLFTANDGTDRVYLEGPLQEAMTWLNGLGVAQNAVLSLGAMLWRFSTKDFDCDTVDLNKRAHYLDLSRKVSTGTVKLDGFRNQGATPVDTVDVDLTLPWEAIGVHSMIQRARVMRFLLRTQTPDIDKDVELYDLVIRVMDSDPR